MRRTRTILAAVLVTAFSLATLVYQAGGYAQKGKACPAAFRVTGVSYDIQHVSTEVISDCITARHYNGWIDLMVTPCDGGAAFPLRERVDIRTRTTLSECGEGMTEGTVSLEYPWGTVSSKLTAVNTDFGRIDGILEGHSSKGAPPFRFRAAISADFVQEADGVYRLDTFTSNGVLFTNAKMLSRDAG